MAWIKEEVLFFHPRDPENPRFFFSLLFGLVDIYFASARQRRCYDRVMMAERMMTMNRLAGALLAAVFLVGAATPVGAGENAPPPRPVSNDYLLHLPGIGGTKRIDRNVTAGLRDAGFNGEIELYDWTENDPGMHALLAYERNHKEAQLIADKIAARAAAQPGGKIFFMSHSGGGGLAVWALEDLPAEVKVETVVLMSPAVSPGYDLTRALQHVRGHMYVFSSLADLIVLGTGTKLFGTIDGVKTDAAGRVGFIQPATADADQYKKLVAMPYDTAWSRYGDMGDHIGGMTRLFGEHVLEPLMLEGKMPPTSMPTTVETPTGLGRER